LLCNQSESKNQHKLQTVCLPLMASAVFVLQRGIVAHLHEELSSSTERLQAELAEWQGRCEALEGQLQAQQAHSSQLEQDLKTRPTLQQVMTTLFLQLSGQ